MIIGLNFWVLSIKYEIKDLMDKETRMWFQRSKAHWSTHGDKNSNYFHSRAT